MIVAAPFLGEFGWEVGMWVPWLRWMRYEMHRSSDFVVMCREGSQPLYADFASKVVVPRKLPDVHRVDNNNAFVTAHGRYRQEDYFKLVLEELAFKQRKVRKTDVLTPPQIPYMWPPERPPILRRRRDFVYGDEPGVRTQGCIAIHARHCKDKQPERNWALERWNALLEDLGATEVIAVGSKDGALCPEGARDARGDNLYDLACRIARCEFGLGPSSGPLHFINACRTPVFWWSANKKDQERYESAWNPHKLPNTCVKTHWNPEPEEVAACIRTVFSL